MTKRVLVGINENGNPIYATLRQENFVNPDLKPGLANAVNPDLQPAKWNPEMGRNPEVGKGNLGLSAAQKVQYGAAFEKPGIQPFKESDRPDGKSSLLIDYSKTPDATTVPGQPGYDESKDPFRKKSEKEKGNKKSPHEIHREEMEARRLQMQLETEKMWIETLYPGARGRQHSPGGNNLGDPSWTASGGHAVQGEGTWRSDSGLDLYDGNDDIVLQEVLANGNAYGD